MTNEEARAIMTRLKQAYINLKTISDLKKKTVKENIKAYDMAIEALETIPKYKDAYGKGWIDGAKASYEHLKMCEEEQGDDLISRQAVLDIIHCFFTEEVDKIPTKKTEDGEVLIMCKAQPLFAMNKTLCKRIKELPSVTAEPQENDHKCHTCKHYTSGEHDGSCGSYICKEYSNWESEDKE